MSAEFRRLAGCRRRPFEQRRPSVRFGNVLPLRGHAVPIHRLSMAAAVLPVLAALVVLPVRGVAAEPAKLVACPDNPVAGLIAEYPKGGDDLTAAIAKLVATQPCVADDVIAAAESAQPALAAALAAGLAQGAASLATTDPAAARQIRAAVYRSGNRSFATAFSIAYSVALAANPASLASTGGLPEYGTLQGNTTVSPH